MKKRIVGFLSVMLLFVILCVGCDKKEETPEAESVDGMFQTMNKEEMQALFADYDLTMVNIWATWCGPCVGEMPELASLHKELPENVNMITVCTDSFESLQAAQDILKNCQSEFMTLHVNEDVQEYLLQNITAYPTTVFVNKDGDFVGEPVIGARFADQYMEEIQIRLE